LQNFELALLYGVKPAVQVMESANHLLLYVLINKLVRHKVEPTELFQIELNFSIDLINVALAFFSLAFLNEELEEQTDYPCCPIPYLLS